MLKKILKHPKIVLVISIIITVLLAIPLKNLKVESSIRQFFPQKHESYKRLNETEAEFGSMISIGVSLETPGETILTKSNIETIRKITTDLEDVENTSDVKSLTNIDYIEGDQGTITVAPLFDKDDSYEVTDEDISQIKERLTAWEDMYDLVVISKDGKATQISLNVDPSVDLETQQAALSEVRSIVLEDIKNTDLIMKIYGEPVISEDSKAYMLSDLAVMIPLVVLVVLLSLYFTFNTLDGTILPIITVLMSTIWSVGLMTMSGMEFSLVSSAIPVALIACGSAYGIHVLTHYYLAVDKKRLELENNNLRWTKEIHIQTIIEGLNDVWVAVLLSAITTIVGFISLVTSPVRPLFGFAIFTALGIGFSLILSVTLIPSLLTFKKIESIGKRSRRMEKLTQKLKKKMEKIESSRVKNVESNDDKNNISPEAPGLGNTLYNFYHFFCGSKSRLIVFSLTLAIFCAVGVSKMVIDTSMVNYFPKNSRLRQDINYVNDNFAGTNSIFLLIKSPASVKKDEATKLYNQAAELQKKMDENNDNTDYSA